MRRGQGKPARDAQKSTRCRSRTSVARGGSPSLQYATTCNNKRLSSTNGQRCLISTGSCRKRTSSFGSKFCFCSNNKKSLSGSATESMFEQLQYPPASRRDPSERPFGSTPIPTPS